MEGIRYRETIQHLLSHAFSTHSQRIKPTSFTRILREISFHRPQANIPFDRSSSPPRADVTALSRTPHSFIHRDISDYRKNIRGRIVERFLE